MFNKRYIILASMGVFALSSCGKKFLDKKPLAVISDENFYKTEGDIVAAVNAAYDPLNWQTDASTGVYCNDYFYGDVASDDSRKGSTESDLGDINAFEKFQLTPTNQQIKHTWRNAYRGIYLANLVIENADKSSASQAAKNNVIGQALFLRAFYHFKLRNIFGEIPYITKVLQQGEFNAGNTSMASIYTQLESDLTAAISKLPKRGATDEGRATKGAAQALLMRVYLFQGKWQNVFDTYTAFEADNGGKYGLEDNFADVFSVAKMNGKESIFAIQGIGADNGDVDNFARRYEGLLLCVMTAPRGDYGGWGFNRPTPNLVAEFKSEKDKDGNIDPRFKATIVSNGDMIGATNIAIPESDSTGYPYTRYYNRKYILDKVAGQFLSSKMNFILLRYSDILLMAAEAANELGKNTEALTYLNKVRARANMAPKTTTDKDALRNEIWRERRVELAMEGLRFFDLVRQGRAGSVMRATETSNFVEGKGFVDGKHEYFPIPQEEIDLSGGALQQNKGY
jgi:starch-binding outer membrane protein, SusD/RagB family